VKVLAKLGLVTAAAATVLFIFIYEFQGHVINRVMSQPPSQVQTVNPIEKAEDLTTEPEATPELPAQVEEVQLEPEVTPVATEEIPEISQEQPVAAEAPAMATRRIYGKITLDDTGEQLGGVNIMIPGATVAKVSNPNGGYTIEVPENTRELIFIYRGKKLVKPVNSGNSLMNVALNLESMQYD
jgi:type IV secretory pathway VirB10-like protein